MRMSLSHMHGSSCAAQLHGAPTASAAAHREGGEAHPDLVDLALQGGDAVLALAHLLRQLRLLVAQAVRLAVRAPVHIEGGALVLLRSLCTTMNYSWLLHSIAEIMDILPWG